MAPLVTVVSSFHNCADVLSDSIESALAQDYSNIEFVFVDDASTDGTSELLRQYARPDLRIYRFERNQGAGAALRFACGHGRGELIAYHEAGDLSHPRRVSAQVKAFLSRPEAGAIASFAEYRGMDGSITGINRPDASADLLRRMLDESIFCHSEMMYRRTAYEAVGGYRSFFRYSQDVDLFLRLAEQYPFVVVPEVLVVKRARRGGVMTEPTKRLQSRYYRSFAEHCSRERQASRPDPLAVQGERAFRTRPHTSKLADNLARDAMRLLVSGDRKNARLIARHAIGEKITVRSSMAVALTLMPSVARRLAFGAGARLKKGAATP